MYACTHTQTHTHILTLSLKKTKKGVLKNDFLVWGQSHIIPD